MLNLRGLRGLNIAKESSNPSFSVQERDHRQVVPFLHGKDGLKPRAACSGAGKSTEAPPVAEEARCFCDGDRRADRKGRRSADAGRACSNPSFKSLNYAILTICRESLSISVRYGGFPQISHFPVSRLSFFQERSLFFG